MTYWRVAIAIFLLLVVGLPLAMPFAMLLQQPTAWQAWADYDRIATLAMETALLVGGTLAIAVPLGIVGAILLYRTDLPLRRVFRLVTILTLFVPLPLFTTAWQAALDFLMGVPFQPWVQGIGLAIWIHALAGLPWVVLLVGHGLCWVEPELEEDALLMVPPWRVLWHVTLVRSRAAIAAAALWVTILTAGEISVTDMMQVRTFAEEVYTQIILVGDEGFPRALVVAIPALVLTWFLILWAGRNWERNLPPRDRVVAPPREFPLGQACLPVFVVVLLAVGFMVIVPIVGLVWKAGLSGSPETWSWQTVRASLTTVVISRHSILTESLLVAGFAGLLAGLLGLLICWSCLRTRWYRAGVFALLAAAWAMPGPVIGQGLKDAIALVITVLPFRPLEDAIYFGPSPVPVVWVDVVRFLPCAAALLWPVVRLTPTELLDAAQVDGAGPGRVMRSIVIPLFAPITLWAGLAVAVLSLGELSASKTLNTPGFETFTTFLFAQMHYSVANDVPALCLMLLGVVACGGVLVVGARWLLNWYHAKTPRREETSR